MQKTNKVSLLLITNTKERQTSSVGRKEKKNAGSCDSRTDQWSIVQAPSDLPSFHILFTPTKTNFRRKHANNRPTHKANPNKDLGMQLGRKHQRKDHPQAASLCASTEARELEQHTHTARILLLDEFSHRGPELKDLSVDDIFVLEQQNVDALKCVK